MKVKKKKSVFIIEDNRLLRDGISSMINEQPDLKVIASFGEREKSLTSILSIKPDVVLIDLGLKSQNSLQFVKSLREKSNDIKIIVMDLMPVQSDILDFVKAGASGFIVKDASVVEFLKTIRSVLSGEKVLPKNMTGSLFTQIIERAVKGVQDVDLMESVRMTNREKQIIELIADGLSNKEIAQNLHLSTYTVKSHVHNILEKMALHTRVQIAKYAHTRRKISDTSGSISLLDNES